jgi:L-rhamnose mutarotase
LNRREVSHFKLPQLNLPVKAFIYLRFSHRKGVSDLPTSTPNRFTHLVEFAHSEQNSRQCFQLHVKPECIDEYVRVHQDVWPEMLNALTECGWRNYSLFLREEDGLVIGYFEADDVEEARRLMVQHPVNAKWQKEMAQYFVPGSPETPLPQYFRLT